MPGNISSSSTIRFDAPGTLPRPRLIGRSIRLLLGVFCLAAAWDLGPASQITELLTASWWFAVIIALILVNYVVNIGFGLSIGNWPLLASIALLLLAGLVSVFLTNGLIGTPLWLVAAIWMAYVYGHLALSFLVSAIIATPGCEMRALPHVLGMAQGKSVAEHYCPAFIDKLDLWELRRANSEADGHDHVVNDMESTVHEGASQDLFSGAGGYLVFYGAPFAVLQLAGNLGNFVIATRVPALACLFVAVVCCINIIRSKRVHCYFTAPLFLLMALLLSLYSFRMIDFGPDTWSIIVNGGLIAAVCISVHLESGLGKYRR